MVTFWRLPLIYAAILLVRGLCICLLNPLFRLAGSHMSPGEILFSTVGGLRGAISLILAQMLVTQFEPNPEEKDSQQVQAQVRSLVPRSPLRLPVLLRPVCAGVSTLRRDEERMDCTNGVLLCMASLITTPRQLWHMFTASKWMWIMNLSIFAGHVPEA